MGDIELDDVDITGLDEHTVTDSLAYHGPPGTGKTTQSGARVARLIRDHGYSVSDVCWVTYRKSLARDTLRRLAEWGVMDHDELSNPSEGATRHIGTAHAVGRRVGSFGEDVVQEWHRADFCKKRNMDYWTGEPWEDSAGKLLFRVLDYIANANERPDDPGAVQACSHTEDLRDHWQGDIVEAWRDWEDYKGQMKIIDFHEMLERPLRDGAAPGKPILVIDEYHDVTALMDSLFRMWMDNAEIVIVAGDPHQVVNAYDGASPRFFEALDLPTVLLDKTYRVPEEHWALATGVLQEAHGPPDVERIKNGLVNDVISPTFEYSSDNGWVTSPGPDIEASPGWMAERYGDGSMLFLTRTRMQADGVGAALERGGIPYRSQPELSGWNTERAETRLALHNALQTIRGYGTDNFGYSTIGAFTEFSGGKRDPSDVDLSNTEAAKLLRAVSAHDLDVTRAEADGEADDLEDDEEGAISLRAFDKFVKRTFWERYTAGESSVDRLNKSVFGTGVKADREIAALKDALARLDDRIDIEDVDKHVITIHASKGMEADDVVVYDGVSSRILKEIQTNGDAHQNEYRTWYVALSRASKRLHVMRGGFDWTNQIIPSDLQGAARSD